MVSARCGKTGAATVFASAVQVTANRMLADNTRSVLDKWTHILDKRVHYKLREHVDSFCNKRKSI
jgi:hypothetical protein